MKKLHYLIAFIIIICQSGLFAQSSANMITFGKNASANEGDDNNFQIFFIKIPSSISDSLTLRLFDPDCGGVNDQKVGEWNTETEFSLYGGKEAFSSAYSNDIYGKQVNLYAGSILASRKYSIDPYTDNEWIDFAKFIPAAGAEYESYHILKLTVTGLKGDDGNTFNLFVSKKSGLNVPVEGVEIFSYNPSLRIDKKKYDPILRFRTNSETAIEAANYDAANAPLTLQTPVRSNLALRSSGDGVWERSSITLNEFETNKVCGIIIGKGSESPNDVTFYARTKSGEYLPMLLPVESQRSNSSPEIVKTIEFLNDCYSVVIDATGTIDKDGDIISFSWDFGDGTKGEGNRVVHKYPERKSYTVKLLASDNSGTVGNDSYVIFQVPVNKSPAANFSFKQIAAPNEKVTFDASSSSDEDGVVTKYNWDFGDGSTGDGKIYTHSYNKSGKYTIELTVRDNSTSPCNFGKISKEIWVNAEPVAKAGQDSWAAIGDEVRFDASASFDPDGKISKYSWDFGDGAKSSGEKVTHSYNKSGRYKVTLRVDDDADVANSFSMDNLTIKVNFPPVAKAGKDQIVAQREVVYFSGSESSDEDGEIVKYEWAYGDGAYGEGINVSHAYANPGKYKVHLRITDNSGTKSAYADDELTVIVNDVPKVTIGGEILVTESAVQFDGSGAVDNDGTISRYEWDFGDGSKSNEKSPLHIYKNFGVYIVKLKVLDNSGTVNNSAEAYKKVTINAKPVADAGMNKIGAPVQVIEFSGAGSFDPDGTIADYEWNMGDGTVLHGKVIQHTYSKQGLYRVKLKVIDNTLQSNAVSFSEITATINGKPTAVAGSDIIAAPMQNFELDGSKSFSGSGTISKYEWEISPGLGIVEGKTVMRTIKQPGTYFAILTVTDNSGAINATAIDTIKIKINSQPVSNSGKNVYTCERKLTFDGSSSTDADGDPLTYIWNFGDGSPTEKGMQVTHTFIKGGTYPIVLTVDDGMKVANSTSTSSITVKINEPPLANAGSDMIVCAGETVRFNGGESKDPENGVLKYLWDFGEGSKGEGMNPTKIYKLGGTYQVTLKVEDDSGLPCNSDNNSIVVVVSESPVARAGKDMIACANAVLKFDGSASTNYDGVVNNYSWDFGDGTVGGGSMPTHSYAKPDVYRVTLTITGDVKGECDNTDSDQITVTVYDAPKVDFTIPQNYPVGKVLTLSAKPEIGKSVEILEYVWDFGDGSSAKGQTVNKTYTKYGNYFARVTITTDAKTDCHTATTQKLIVVNEKPVSKIIANNKVGLNQPLDFSGAASKDADGSLQVYEWNFGDGQKGSGINVRRQYSKSGYYYVTLRVKDNTNLENNFDVDTLKVRVNETPVPIADFKASVTPCEEVTFEAARSSDKDGTIKSYSWNFGDGYTAEGVSVKHIYPVEGIYNVSLSVDDGDNLANSRDEVVRPIKVNSRPQVVLGPSRNICPGEVLSLVPKKVFDADNTEFNYKWNVSDGFSSSEKELKHSFARPGVYSVALTIDDKENTSCSQAADTVQILVNSAPVIKVIHPDNGFTGGAHDEILLDAAASSDADGDALDFIWDFGDGTKGSGATVYHLYEKSGTFQVRLTVSDNINTNCSSSTAAFSLVIKKH